jgi:hypothetical protein
MNNDISNGNGIKIAKSEHGVIRVFSISRPMAQMARTLASQPKAALASELLGHRVSDEHIELFALSDLAGVGLVRYLGEGYDIDQTALNGARARLEALDGYVLLLHSGWPRAGDVVLNPAPELTLIGTFCEPRPAASGVPLAVAAALPYSGAMPPPEPPGRARAGSALTAAAVLLTLLFIWWILR